MSLIIDRLIIEVQTADGKFGLDMPFSNGLFVLRVENSHGKSTCMNAIAYALGMEMALGQQSSKPPFPPSLLKAIQDEDGREIGVISSHVKLQLTNHEKNTVTLKRNALGADADSIIEKYRGEIDEIDSVPQKLFLHREGDSTRDLGFYHWLSDFIGWELPYVPNNSGGQSPLYPPIIFPLMFVEQKKGWSSIQATTPFHFNIPQAKKRAFEFVMNLDVNDIVRRKAENKKSIDFLISSWADLYGRLSNVAVRVGGRIAGIKDYPNAKFDLYKLDILVEDNGKWHSLSTIIDQKRNQLRDVLSQSKQYLPTVANDPAQIERLKKFKSDLRHSEERYDSLQDEIAFLDAQIDATQIRIKNLSDDKRKYEDLKKIKSYQSLNGFPVVYNECPTCGQAYSDHTTYVECSDDLMTLQESLDFIKSQFSTFTSMLNSYRSQLKDKDIEMSRLNKAIEAQANEISRIKHVLYSDESHVDEAFLRDKIILENTISELESALVELASFRNEFDSLQIKYKELVRIRRGFPQHGFSKLDLKKIGVLKNEVVSNLEQFGFSSFSPELIEISKDSYLPTREGFDLGFDTSASDGIRVIWSYLLAIFSMRTGFSTNHPGVLLFDEPRQQEANQMSFVNLLKVASKKAGQGQVIFATSEEEDVLIEGLEGCDYIIRSFRKGDGKILKRLKA